MRFWVVLHALLLLVAATYLTIFTSVFGGESLRWCYYHFSRNIGFGTQYVSSFSIGRQRSFSQKGKRKALDQSTIS